MSKLVCIGRQSKKNKKGGMGRVPLAILTFSIGSFRDSEYLLTMAHYEGEVPFSSEVSEEVVMDICH